MNSLKNNCTFIFLENLEVKNIVGIYPHEREKKQPIIIDGKIYLKIKKKDDLSSTLDYDAVVNSIKKISEDYQPFLLEVFLEKIANNLLAHPLVEAVYLKSHKKNLYSPAKLGVAIYRQKQSS